MVFRIFWAGRNPKPSQWCLQGPSGICQLNITHQYCCIFAFTITVIQYYYILMLLFHLLLVFNRREFREIMSTSQCNICTVSLKHTECWGNWLSNNYLYLFISFFSLLSVSTKTNFVVLFGPVIYSTVK